MHNCVHIGGHALGINDFGFPHDRGEELSLTNNTLVSRIPAVVFAQSQHLLDTHRNELAAPTRIEASHNVFDAKQVLHFILGDRVPVVRDESGSFVHYALHWRDHQNLHSAGGCAMTSQLPEGIAALPPVSNPSQWNDFWKQPDAAVAEGVIRLQGGDLLSRLETAPESLTPEDFRLRPDSAGSQAGPDGKDLGANVDLVGPGEAYERWKKTPEYQEWLTETAKLLSGEGSGRQEGRTEGD
jgi:hypothetical protein